MKIHSFSSVAKAYTQKVSPGRFSQFLTLVHELGLSGSERVLDIGAGPGVLSMEIAKQLDDGGFLSAIDLSPDMVNLARTAAEAHGRDNIEFDHGDALNLKYNDSTFDVVASSNAFPWVPDRSLFLREVFRVLKPGGRFGLVALSSRCYREFSDAYRRVSSENPGLFPDGRPFEIMGARLHHLTELGRLVTKTGFEVTKRFQFSTEEPISAHEYVGRVNAIVNENYLDHLGANGRRDEARDLILKALAGQNGELRVTESSIFVFARRPK